MGTNEALFVQAVVGANPSHNYEGLSLNLSLGTEQKSLAS